MLFLYNTCYPVTIVKRSFYYTHWACFYQISFSVDYCCTTKTFQKLMQASLNQYKELTLHAFNALHRSFRLSALSVGDKAAPKKQYKIWYINISFLRLLPTYVAQGSPIDANDVLPINTLFLVFEPKMLLHCASKIKMLSTPYKNTSFSPLKYI